MNDLLYNLWIPYFVKNLDSKTIKSLALVNNKIGDKIKSLIKKDMVTIKGLTLDSNRTLKIVVAVQNNLMDIEHDLNCSYSAKKCDTNIFYLFPIYDVVYINDPIADYVYSLPCVKKFNCNFYINGIKVTKNIEIPLRDIYHMIPRIQNVSHIHGINRCNVCNDLHFLKNGEHCKRYWATSDGLNNVVKKWNNWNEMRYLCYPNWNRHEFIEFDDETII